MWGLFWASSESLRHRCRIGKIAVFYCLSCVFKSFVWNETIVAHALVCNWKGLLVVSLAVRVPTCELWKERVIQGLLTVIIKNWLKKSSIQSTLYPAVLHKQSASFALKIFRNCPNNKNQRQQGQQWKNKKSNGYFTTNVRWLSAIQQLLSWTLMNSFRIKVNVVSFAKRKKRANPISMSITI